MNVIIKTADYGGGVIHAQTNLTEGPAGLGNGCDNFHRQADGPMKRCSAPARWRISYLSGARCHSVKRCDDCVRQLRQSRISQHILRCEEIGIKLS